VTYADGKFTLEVSGSDIGGTHDEFVFAYKSAGTPGVEYPVIIEQFLGANGLGNGGSCVLPLYIEAMQELSTVDVILTAGF
jgi:hypothetical protein